MDSPRMLRLLGTVLVVAAVVGLVANLAAMVAVVVVERQLEDGLMGGIDVLAESLSVTADGLRVADETLAHASEAMTNTQEALSTASRAVAETLPSLQKLEVTIGTDVPRTIESTRGAVLSAQTSAAAVDDVLDKLSRIPLLGLAQYRPETPLAESLGEVAASLKELPDSVRDMRTGLSGATTSAGKLRRNLNDLAGSIGDVGRSLEDARAVVADYQAVVERLQEQTERARESIPVWLGRLRWAAWFVLAWLAIAQIALFTQGLELISRSRTGAPS